MSGFTVDTKKLFEVVGMRKSVGIVIKPGRF